MKYASKIPDNAVLLRQKAEELFRQKQSDKSADLSEIDTLKLLYELEVHQIELKIQNEELQQAKEKAETLAEKYSNLYDFAPAGYFTLNNDCQICELNLSGAKMLGKERSKLINYKFNQFITNDTRPLFNIFFNRVLNTLDHQSCEVQLSLNQKPGLFVHLNGIATGNGQQTFITAVDVSERTLLEIELVKANKRIKYENSFFIDRELRMIELKEEINSLLILAGKEKKYDT
jgi:PAS domain-containing protein